MQKTIFAVLLTLTGCVSCHQSSPSSDERPRAVLDLRGQKQYLLETVHRHYLWNTTLPADVKVDDHATLDDLLNHLTTPARQARKDRGWSYLKKDARPGAPVAAQSQQWQLGLGMLLQERQSRVQVAQSLPGSGAGRAGVSRGDELVAASLTQAGLDLPENQAMALQRRKGWGPLLNGARGEVRHFRVRKAGTGAVVDLAIAREWFAFDLVPGWAAPVVLQAGAGHRVGYLQLLEFEASADAQLRQAMNHFLRHGVTDFILDLRYNGGGELPTLRLLCDLLHRGHPRGALMATLRGNAAFREEQLLFQEQPESIRPGRIAIITHDQTASASESVVNLLVPYYRQNLAMVGTRTVGKPVGQTPMAIPDCDSRLWLTNFRVLNMLDHGDYFSGLPDQGFLGSTCLAVDDLAHPPGHPAEGSTAAALRWIEHGTSRYGPIPDAGIQGAVQSAERAWTPSALPPGNNRNIPGLY